MANDIATDIPHQKIWVQIRRIDEIMAQPALRPKTHALDDRKQFAASSGQMILETGAPAAPTLDNSGKLQLFETLRQQGRRHARYPALQIIEPNATAQQLANNERHPSFRQYLRSERDGAELTVSALLSHANSDLRSTAKRFAERRHPGEVNLARSEGVWPLLSLGSLRRRYCLVAVSPRSRALKIICFSNATGCNWLAG